VVVDCGWKVDITVCILNQQWPPQFQRHLPIPDIDAPPNSAPHFPFNGGPRASLAVQANVLRNTRCRSQPSPGCGLEVHLSQENTGQDRCPRMVNNEFVIPHIYQHARYLDIFLSFLRPMNAGFSTEKDSHR
jgi:hypothetical protein